MILRKYGCDVVVMQIACENKGEMSVCSIHVSVSFYIAFVGGDRYAIGRRN